jgi:hypothetical protein
VGLTGNREQAEISANAEAPAGSTPPPKRGASRADWRPSNCIDGGLTLKLCVVRMLRIEIEMDGSRTLLRLIGRLRFDCIEELRQRVEMQAPLMVIDLAEVDLVDVQSVRFLRDCQDLKIEVRNCAPYILEWIRRERIEGLT